MIIRNRTASLFRRVLSTQAKNDIGQIFIQENVQKLLKDISRFDEGKIFARRTVAQLKSPKLMFMSDEDLEKAKEIAYDHAKARLQMPPVMAPNTAEPAILAQDKDIVGYTKFKVMFIDISPGGSNRNRLMSVREQDGTLREPTYEERARLNHIFYPGEAKSIDPPKLFDETNLNRLLKKKEYLFILNRACVQFEPDDPRYVDITTKVYTFIDEKGDYKLLRSTRHFGPMSLFLAYNKQIDNLLLEMLAKDLVVDATKLVQVYNTCHDIISEEDGDPLGILKQYVDNYSAQKYNLELAIQKFNNPS